MALTEEQKRKLQAKAEAEIAAVRQKQEEQEYYEQLLAEQGIIRTVRTPQDQRNEQTVMIVRVVAMILAFVMGVSLVLPYASTLGISIGFVNNITGNHWVCILILSIVAFVCIFCENYRKSIGAGILNIIALFVGMDVPFWKSLPSTEMSVLVQHGVGWYVMLVGSIGVSVMSIVLNKLTPEDESVAGIKRRRIGTEVFGVGMILIVCCIFFSVYHGR